MPLIELCPGSASHVAPTEQYVRQWIRARNIELPGAAYQISATSAFFVCHVSTLLNS
jgi:hypothetical protein